MSATIPRINRKTEIEKEALRLFRLVHGPGDAGSEHCFWCQNDAVVKGWLRMAKMVLREREY